MRRAAVSSTRRVRDPDRQGETRTGGEFALMSRRVLCGASEALTKEIAGAIKVVDFEHEA